MDLFRTVAQHISSSLGIRFGEEQLEHEGEFDSEGLICATARVLRLLAAGNPSSSSDSDSETELPEQVVMDIQSSVTIEEEEESIRRRLQRRSARRSRNRSNSTLHDTIQDVLKVEPQQPTFEISRRILSTTDGKSILLKIIKSKHAKELLLLLSKYLPVDQTIELSLLSSSFLKHMQGFPLRLNYLKTVIDYSTLESVFGGNYNEDRVTSWTIAGLYASISELPTLFQVVEPKRLHFLGLVHQSIRNITAIIRCTCLVRFEIHSCNYPLSLAPLLECKDTLREISILACQGIEDISILEKIPLLESLSTFKSSQMKRLPDFRLLPNLKVLYLGECVNISYNFCEQLQSLRDLRFLDVSFLKKIYNLDLIKRCTNLDILILDSCTGVDSIEELQYAGKHLRLLRLNGIMGLPSLKGVSACTELRVIELGDLVTIRTIQPLANLCHLVDVRLRNCIKINSLVALRKSASTLQRIDISGCKLIVDAETVEFLEQCSELSIFECSKTSSALLVRLAMSTHPVLLVAAELYIPEISSVDEFYESGYPVMVQKLTFAKSETDRQRALKGIRLVLDLCPHTTATLYQYQFYQPVFDIVCEDKTTPLASKLEALRLIAMIVTKIPAASKDPIFRTQKSFRVLAGILHSYLEADVESKNLNEDLACESGKLLVLLLASSANEEIQQALLHVRELDIVHCCCAVLKDPQLLDRTRAVIMLVLSHLSVCEQDLAAEMISHDVIDVILINFPKGAKQTKIISLVLLETLTSGSASISKLFENKMARESFECCINQGIDTQISIRILQLLYRSNNECIQCVMRVCIVALLRELKVYTNRDPMTRVAEQEASMTKVLLKLFSKYLETEEVQTFLDILADQQMPLNEFTDICVETTSLKIFPVLIAKPILKLALDSPEFQQSFFHSISSWHKESIIFAHLNPKTEKKHVNTILQLITLFFADAACATSALTFNSSDLTLLCTAIGMQIRDNKFASIDCIGDLVSNISQYPKLFDPILFIVEPVARTIEGPGMSFRSSIEKFVVAEKSPADNSGETKRKSLLSRWSSKRKRMFISSPESHRVLHFLSYLVGTHKLLDTLRVFKTKQRIKAIAKILLRCDQLRIIEYCVILLDGIISYRDQLKPQLPSQILAGFKDSSGQVQSQLLVTLDKSSSQVKLATIRLILYLATISLEFLQYSFLADDLRLLVALADCVTSGSLLSATDTQEFDSLIGILNLVMDHSTTVVSSIFVRSLVDQMKSPNAELVFQAISKLSGSDERMSSILEAHGVYTNLVSVLKDPKESQAKQLLAMSAIGNYIDGSVAKFVKLDDETKLTETLIKSDIGSLEYVIYPMLNRVSSSTEKSQLGTRLVQSCLIDMLDRWKMKVIASEIDGLRLSESELLIPGKLLLPLKEVLDKSTLQYLSDDSMLKLLARIYLRDGSTVVHESAAELMLVLSSDLVDESSEKFHTVFDELLDVAMQSEFEYLEMQNDSYPFVLNRVRGAPGGITFDELFEIQIHHWTTMSLYSRTSPRIFQVYYEVAIVSFKLHLTFGWLSMSEFQTGMLAGHSVLGIGNQSSWGYQLSNIADYDVLGCAADMATGRLTYFLNGITISTTSYDRLKHPVVFPAFTAESAQVEINFGHQPFRYACPQGYFSVCRAYSS